MKSTEIERAPLVVRANQGGLLLVGTIIISIFLSSTARAQVDLDDLKSALEVINHIEPGGVGHEKAIVAIKVLNSATPEQVPVLLSGIDGGNKLAQNWIRGAIQSALAGSDALPVESIRNFLDDLSGSDMGRLIAYELLVEDSPELSDSLLPKFIDDPCLPLRQLSIAWYIGNAEKAGESDAVLQLASTLPHARNVDQVQDIAKRLAKRGVNIDLQRQLGFINEWKIVGPFDNRKEEGFARAAGPEIDINGIDVGATYSDTLDGTPARWTTHRSVEPAGVLNLIDVFGKLKGVTAYAYAEFEATEEADCELRIGCINATRVWLNGQEVMSNEIYHVGMMPDQFSGPGKLAKGANKILIKICQNEQEEPWAQDWMFQLRICHPDGSAIAPAPPATSEQ